MQCASTSTPPSLLPVGVHMPCTPTLLQCVVCLLGLRVACGFPTGSHCGKHERPKHHEVSTAIPTQISESESGQLNVTLPTHRDAVGPHPASAPNSLLMRNHIAPSHVMVPVLLCWGRGGGVVVLRVRLLLSSLSELSELCHSPPAPRARSFVRATPLALAGQACARL